MILRQSRLRAMLFAAFFAWFICGIGYYALTISAQELFPTRIRNTIIGLTATSARVGGILAPFCAQLDRIFPDLNLIVLGVGSLLAGASVFKAFPETCGQALPETLKDSL